MAPSTEKKPVRPAAKAGYVWCLFGKDGTCEINGKGMPVPLILKNVLLQYPITKAAIEDCCKEYEYVVKDVDGKEYSFTGIHAAVLSKYDHALETIRGLGRPVLDKKGKVTRNGLPGPALLQRFMAFTGFGGRQRSGGTVSAETLDSFNANNFGSDAEALAALKRMLKGEA